MAHFPTNTLPAEFERDHGSIDLADEKPSVGAGPGGKDDGGEDEELDLGDVGGRVWLVKVPKFLMEKWSEVKEEGVILGKVRVYDEKDVNGDPKIAVILDEPPTPTPTAAASADIKGKGVAGRGSTTVPTEYKLTLQNTATKNMFVFGEKEEDVKESGEEGHRKRRRITSMLGTVHHECALTPSLSSRDASSSYRTIMRDRQRKAAEPKRTVKMLDVDQGTANRLASGMGLAGVRGRVSSFVKSKPTASASSGDLRTARIPRNELLDMLFVHFEQAPYWTAKALTEHVKQPQAYLKEVLQDVAVLVPRGPYVGMWKLKEEFRTRGEGKKEEGAQGEGEGKAKKELAGGVKVELEPLDLGDDDDEEMELVS